MAQGATTFNHCGMPLQYSLFNISETLMSKPDASTLFQCVKFAIRTIYMVRHQHNMEMYMIAGKMSL